MPTCGFRWKTTLPPVVLPEWRTGLPLGEAYSTISNWRANPGDDGSVEWQGTWYGPKANEFVRLITLPELVPAPLELCVWMDPKDEERIDLERHGWRVVSPLERTPTAEAYREYVFAARGEVSAVKQGYAAGRTGWFSDRSACYLASGRPVIMQDTGISGHVPTGTGLLTFDSLESAIVALEQVESEYTRHATAAAVFAREFLDSDIVLSRLLRLAGI